MFTGIVTDRRGGCSEPRAEGLTRLKIACGYDPDGIEVGASIACSGVCLTVVGRGKDGNRGWFRSTPPPRRITAVGVAQRHAHQSRAALKVGDELGGHIVAGHADLLALTARDDLTDMARLSFRVPGDLALHRAQGSVALDGVSLTSTRWRTIRLRY
jgi:riboflavin synthase